MKVDEYIVKYGLALINCTSCECFLTQANNLMVGNFDSELDAINYAQKEHGWKFPKCTERRLIIEVTKYYRCK